MLHFSVVGGVAWRDFGERGVGLRTGKSCRILASFLTFPAFKVSLFGLF